MMSTLHRAALRPAQRALIGDDCPDPTAVRVGDAWWLCCTTANEPDRLRLYRSRDLMRWEAAGAVFPAGRAPAWTVGDFWAPELALVGGRLMCWYTARDRSGTLCIGVASASRPGGTWTDLGRPLVRDTRVGQIDPAVLTTLDGELVLYGKTDGNGCRPRRPSVIWGQRMGADGCSLRGPRVPLITNDCDWEGAIVEAPCAIMRHGRCYLFYSGNAFHDHRYAVGVARGPSALGPFEKREDPLLCSGEHWRGPGHGVVVSDGAQDWFLYHAWARGRVGEPHPRQLLRARIVWESDGWPRLVPG